MGMFDEVMGAANSISGSALAVDGMLRTQLGPVYSQISALLERGVGADGIMRKNDMQNLANMLRALPQQGAGSSDGSTARQAKILMMIVQINALRVQVRNLFGDTFRTHAHCPNRRCANCRWRPPRVRAG